MLAAVLVGVDPLPAASAAPPPATRSVNTPLCATSHHDCDPAAITTAVGGATDASLDALLPTLCTADAARPHAYAFFSCLVSVGQAVGARTAGAPDPALAHCRSFPDVWTQQSCAAGVFGKLVAAEVASSPGDDPHAGDPVWPCDHVADVFRVPCYQLSTTRVLWLNGGDVAAGFRTCDQLPGDVQAPCYQSMGRDLTTRAGYDPGVVLQGCAQAGRLGPSACLVGAARTLVYTDHPSAAASLCQQAAATDRAAATPNGVGARPSLGDAGLVASLGDSVFHSPPRSPERVATQIGRGRRPPIRRA